MDNYKHLKEKANSLRKQGDFTEALAIYKELCDKTKGDKFDVAGYLHCIRKLKKYNEGIELGKKYEGIHLDFDWFKNELIWTYIGFLKTTGEELSLTKVQELANKVLKYNLDVLQKNIIVFYVLKRAKKLKNWDVSSHWIDRIDYNTLDKEFKKIGSRTTAWNDYLIWHNHKVRVLIYQKKYQKAIDIVEFIIGEAKPVAKYFRCLEAHAYEKKGEFHRAKKVLMELSNKPKVDWWILHQYANVLRKMGEKDEALVKMYHAAHTANKLKNTVNLLYDIALLSIELEKEEESYYHLVLYTLIRNKENWQITEKIKKLTLDLESRLELEEDMEFHSILKKCQFYWQEKTPKVEEKTFNYVRKRNLRGHLVKVKDEKGFCFINSENESYFCHKSDIKGKPKEGLMVEFDIIPSFDRKKQKNSTKAINIRLI